MNLRFLDGRDRFRPRLSMGPVMWRCTNGRPNHAIEIAITKNTFTTAGISMNEPVTPALVFTPWHKSCLATIPPLGIESGSFSVGIVWWKWTWTIGLLITRNTKTQAEVDASMEGVNA